MIDFNTVSREFRGLVDRRRDLFSFLGAAFAAMGLFLQNVMQGNLPPSLAPLERHIFAFYAVMLLVISLVLALRMAKLHAGMVLNGVLFAHLMSQQNFTRKGDPARSARHNAFSVSFLQFILVDLIAGFSAALLLLTLGVALGAAAAGGAAVFLAWMALYFRNYARAVDFAFRKIASEPAGPVREEDWREHLSLCLQQANHGLLAEIAFAGLIVFSGFEAMSGFGKVQPREALDLGVQDVIQQGPLVYSILMLVTCFLELIIYLRVRVAIGGFCVQLDPTDRPFRPLRLTDSLLGYMLLAFLFCVSLHVLLVQALPALNAKPGVLLGIDAGAFVLAALAEQLTLVAAGRRYHGLSTS